MNILGLSAFYHDSACCLLRDGELVAAAQEERFSRVKHDPRLPVAAFRFCLEAGGLGIDELDCVAYYESPVNKLSRQLWCGPPAEGAGEMPWLDPSQPERLIRERLGFEGPIEVFAHHHSHAASAFFFSGFHRAAVLTVDGVGEWSTTTFGVGDGSRLEILREVDFPHSLGLLYSTLTAYLGFRVNAEEGKVMGLAPYGAPRYLEEIRNLIRLDEGGGFELDLRYFDFLRGRSMYSQRLCSLLGAPPRQPGEEISERHCDVARSLQQVLEEALLVLAGALARQVDSANLCLAGGVALNCVANGRLLREGPFERLFVQPAAGDAGGCLGAAALAYLKRGGRWAADRALRHVYLGPRWSTEQVAQLLSATGVQALDFRQRHERLLEAVVDRLAERRVVGWFQGAMELGPRALGARSILAHPADPEIRERLNRVIKRRESFRPFAPSVLWSHCREHFELDQPVPFMVQTCQVRSPLVLPAITHVDGSARPQTVTEEDNPRFAALLGTFYRRSGYPMLLNTSFNLAGEPIVCSPLDALLCMGRSGLDALAIEDFLIDRHMLPPSWNETLPAWRSRLGAAFDQPRSALGENLYSFV